MANRLTQAIQILFSRRPSSLPPERLTEVGRVLSSLIEMSTLWRLGSARAEIHRDLTLMDDEDEIISTGLNIHADCASGIKSPGEKIVQFIADDDALQNAGNSILNRAQVQDNAPDIIRFMVHYGNDFWEFLVDDTQRFAGIKWLPDEHHIFINLDEFGRFKDGDPENVREVGKCAYDQRNDVGSFLAGFRPWQIVHFRTRRNKYGYGIPMLKSARKNYKRLSIAEDAMAIARLIRAYMKLVHKIPVDPSWGPEEIARAVNHYKESMTKKRMLNWRTAEKPVIELTDDPLSVSTDFYIPDDGSNRGGITSIDPSNPALTNINDILYFQNKIFAALQVPKAYLGVEKDTRAKSTLTVQDLQFARVIGAEQGHFIRGLTKILDQALFLEGFNPEEIKYGIVMPTPFYQSEEEKARIEMMEATAAQRYVSMGIISRTRARIEYAGLTKEETKAEEEEILREEGEFGPLPQAGSPGLIQASSVRSHEQLYESLQEIRKRFDPNGRRTGKNRVKVR